MRKTHVAAIFFTLFLACGAAFAATEAETQAAMDAAMAMMTNEPPLVQADIDAFIGMAPQLQEAAQDPGALMKLCADHNISPQRFGVISSKIAFGVMLGQGISREDLLASGQVPEFMMPNSDEEGLIQKNMAALMKAVGE